MIAVSISKVHALLCHLQEIKSAEYDTAVSEYRYAETVCVLDKSALKGVPLEVMLRFNRLKALTTDEAVVAAALRKSASGLMEARNAFPTEIK